MFNPDFYPTPPDVAAEMLDPLDLRGKTILEPSAGSGSLVQECIARGAEEVLWCEKEAKLRDILSSITGATPTHSYQDFLQVHASDISHVDMIVMNPPFSADETHILHAWEIAPPGCEIVSLCNWNTISGGRWGRRAELAAVIKGYGQQTNLGECFADSERPTRVGGSMNSQVGVFYVPKTLVDVLAERLYEPSAGTGAWLLEAGRRIRIGGHDALDLDLGCRGVMIVKHSPRWVSNQQATNHVSGNQH